MGKLVKPKKKNTPTVTTNKGRTVETTKPKDNEVALTPAVPTRENHNGTVPTQGQATISLSLGATINMGDYESARIDVSITRNVDDTDEKIDEGYKQTGQKLQNELIKQINNMQGEE